MSVLKCTCRVFRSAATFVELVERNNAVMVTYRSADRLRPNSTWLICHVMPLHARLSRYVT